MVHEFIQKQPTAGSEIISITQYVNALREKKVVMVFRVLKFSNCGYKVYNRKNFGVLKYSIFKTVIIDKDALTIAVEKVLEKNKAYY